MSYADHLPADAFKDLAVDRAANEHALLTGEVGASAPPEITDGMLWSNTTANMMQQRVGASWYNLWPLDEHIDHTRRLVGLWSNFATVECGFRPLAVTACVSFYGDEAGLLVDSRTVTFVPHLVGGVYINGERRHTIATNHQLEGGGSPGAADVRQATFGCLFSSTGFRLRFSGAVLIDTGAFEATGLEA